MSRCPYCRSELPGLETLCQKCWEKQYASPASAKPWLPKGVPRLTRGNLGAFLLFFVFCFLQWRFDFPYFHQRHFLTNGESVLAALLLASAAVYMQGDR
jgi:hypothetical protein